MPRLRPATKPEEPEKIEAAPEAPVDDNPIEVEIIESQPEVVVAPAENEATTALRKQVDDLKKSEEIQRQAVLRANQDRDEALQRARARDIEVNKIQKEAYDSQADAIASALAAAGSEADKAQLDIENAINLGDPKGQAEAQRRLAMATANLSRLEAGKEAIEARAKEPPRQEQPNNELSRAKQDYIAKHPEISSNKRINDRATFYHREAIADGIAEDSEAYFKYMDESLGYTKEDPPDEPTPPPKKPGGGNIVSAPVSREVTGSNGKKPVTKVTLTAQEVEAAKLSGITVEEYAKQKQRYQDMQASGEYSNQR